jgi:hypothetical protein
VLVSASAFDMAATRHFFDRSGAYRAVKPGEIAVGLIAMRIDPRTPERGRAWNNS